MSGVGHGKVILLGEHAVVHGTRALGAAIGRGAVADAAAADEDVLRVEPFGTEHRPGDGTPLGRAFGAALAALPASRPRLAVSARLELPAGAGLGSSAALGVAVLDACAEALGHPASRAFLAEAAFAWEQVFHGRPSGVDNTLAALGGVLCFRRGEAPERLHLRAPLSLVVAHSGAPGNTHDTVDRVARQLARDEGPTRKTIEAIGVLVDNAKLALEAGDLRSVGDMMNINQMLLASLMVSTPALESLCAIAREAGALGAKLTGGGGGGCMIALAPSGDGVLRALSAASAHAFQVEISA